jgi:hypothetical protein
VNCSCGCKVKTVEVRVVQRCTKGHFVTSGAESAVLAAAGPEPVSPGQLRAFHAKTDALDRGHGHRLGTAKARWLQALGKSSAGELTSNEMTGLLDDLQRAVNELE